MEFFEDGGDVEAVDEERGPSGSAGVREKVKELKARGIGLSGEGLVEVLARVHEVERQRTK